jgi:hypothetical protein
MPAPKDPEKYQLFIKRLSESHMGQKLSPERNEKLHALRRGKPLTEEHKQKISKTRLKKGVVISEKQKELAREYMKSHPLPKKHYKRLSLLFKGRTSPMKGRKHKEESKEKIRGENNKGWKGGLSYLPYCFRFNERRRRMVRVFFGYFCICCGKHATENIIFWKNGYKPVEHSVHHIDHDKEQGCNGKPFNLVPLCHECHGKELHKEEEYKKHINKTLEEGFKWGIWSRGQYEIEVMYPEEAETNLHPQIKNVLNLAEVA